MIWWAACAAGVLAGMAGALGVGGGSVLLIYLTVFAGTAQLTAQGINLLFFIPVAALAVFLHAKKHLIDWRRIWPCAAAGLLGAMTGVLLAGVIGGDLLRKIFAGCVLLFGLREVFHKKKSPGINREETTFYIRVRAAILLTGTPAPRRFAKSAGNSPK